MKSKLLFCVLLIYSFLQTNVKSQDFWEEVFTSGPTIFSIDISDEGVIYLGTANGIWKSLDNGDNWEFDTISLGNLVVYSLETNNEGIVYAGCNGSIYYSTDYGVNWTLILDDVVGNVVSILINSNGYIFAGIMSGIYRSTDNGLSWQVVMDLINFETAYSFIEDDQNIIYAGTSIYLPQVELGGLYYSMDTGFTWNHIEITTHYCIQDIAINLDDDLICAVQFKPNSAMGGVFKYEPVIGNWTLLKDNIRTTAIEINPLDFYYVGCDNETGTGGCLVSYDSGNNWDLINVGFQGNKDVIKLSLTPDGYLFAVTKDPPKVFRSLSSTLTNIIENKQIEIIAFPNPTINKLVFKHVPIDSGILFSLVDINGQILLNEVNLNNYSNNSIIEFDLSSINSGLYFYIVSKNNHIIKIGKVIIN